MIKRNKCAEEIISHLKGRLGVGADAEEVRRLRRSILPPSIYKYRSGSSRDIENLRNGNLYLSTPAKFNDPYDSSFSYSLSEDLASEPESKRKFIETHQTAIRVCCFSERIDSMLMWTHYAAEHRGFAVEYSVGQKVENSIWPVFYTDKLFDMIGHIRAGGFVSFLPLIAALHKSSDWSYEEEWRIVEHADVGDKLQMPEPVAIYLGSRAEISVVDELISLGREKNIEVYKMRPDRTRFSLVEEKVV